MPGRVPAPGRRRDVTSESELVSSGIPLVFLERLEADYRGWLTAAVQPEGGGDLIHRILNGACGDPVLELDAGLVAALPVLHGKRAGGEPAGELEVRRAALLVETHVEVPVAGHALPGRPVELEAEADVERVFDPDNLRRWHAARVQKFGIVKRLQQGILRVDLSKAVQVVAWPTSRGSNHGCAPHWYRGILLGLLAA